MEQGALELEMYGRHHQHTPEQQLQESVRIQGKERCIQQATPLLMGRERERERDDRAAKGIIHSELHVAKNACARLFPHCLRAVLWS
jgi:hypothetical protein